MAGMTEDKLQLLENTKEGLKTAINATGHTVGDVFSEYPSAVTAYKDEVDAGYAQIAAAITDKGVPTEATDTPAQMATNIGQISSNTLLEETDSGVFCSAIAQGIPAYLFVSNYGILPIVGLPNGIDYSVNVGSNGNFSFTINTSSTEVVEVLFEGEQIQFHPYLGEVFYGDNIFSEGNIKFFVDALVI